METINTLVVINFSAVGSEALHEDKIAQYDRFILIDQNIDVLNDVALLLEARKKYVVILDKLEGLVQLFKSYGTKKRHHVVVDSYPLQ
ncbi:hypothetical protein [Sphingobacterium psychroaquaticum]|uniref:Uncharacterized protein n=2 Tax=Sphingobacterium psychroaquaticum TaxID=561061 RepID=A0A1X7JQG5_9SPHI|nr:hypothetical protein [Sphingobacterium psychroaquaticum]SMG29939.1 hypothetical protein SAMN05660862_1994 [Sphingobacterium psychroaquaticum]